MRRRKPKPDLTIRVATEWTATVRGTGDWRTLEKLKCPKLYNYRPPDGGSSCWIVPARYAVDVVAAAELLGGTAVIDGQQAML